MRVKWRTHDSNIKILNLGTPCETRELQFGHNKLKALFSTQENQKGRGCLKYLTVDIILNVYESKANAIFK